MITTERRETETFLAPIIFSNNCWTKSASCTKIFARTVKRRWDTLEELNWSLKVAWRKQRHWNVTRRLAAKIKTDPRKRPRSPTARKWTCWVQLLRGSFPNVVPLFRSYCHHPCVKQKVCTDQSRGGMRAFRVIHICGRARSCNVSLWNEWISGFTSADSSSYKVRFLQ